MRCWSWKTKKTSGAIRKCFAPFLPLETTPQLCHVSKNASQLIFGAKKALVELVEDVRVAVVAVLVVAVEEVAVEVLIVTFGHAPNCLPL